MANSESLTREKVLFRYTTALEQGDFDKLETILEMARGDALLEQQIMEINLAMSQPQAGSSASPAIASSLPGTLWQQIRRFIANLLALRSTVKLSGIRIAAGVFSICLLAIVVMALLGPAVGHVFSNAMIAIPTSAPNANYSNQVAATRGVESRLDSYYSGLSAYPAPGRAQSAPQANQIQATQTSDRLIVRNANLTVETGDTRQASQAAVAMIAELAPDGAFIVSSNETYSNNTKMPGILMVLRVPVNRYDECVTRLTQLGTVLGRKETAQDVTQEYVDTTARIEALQTSRARLLQIIKEAKNTDDLLRAEEELSRRESELEVAKARQQNLAKTAALSSISLELRPTLISQPVTDTRWNPATTLYKAITILLDNLRGFTDGAIYFIIVTLPWLVVLGLVVFGLVKLFRKRIQ